jgi:WD40 repeat protein
VASTRRDLAVFDVEHQRFARHVPVPSLDQIDDVVMIPDGSSVVVCGAGEIVVLDPEDFRPRGAPLAAGPKDTDLECELAVSPDSTLVSASWGLAAVGIEGEIWVLRLADGALAGPPIPVPGDNESSAVFSADGRRITRAMGPSGARQWDVATGRPVGPPLLIPEEVSAGAFDDFPSAAAYDPRGRFLLLGDSTGRIHFLAARTLRPVGRSFDVGVSEVAELAFDRNGSRLAVGTAEGEVQIFDVERDRALTPLLSGQRTRVIALSFGAHDRTVLAASTDGTIAVYDVDGQPVTARNLPYGAVAEQTAIQVDASPDGRLVAASHGDGAVVVWDLAMGERVGPSLSAGEGASVDVEFSPDGRLLMASDFVGHVRTWATDTWRQVPPLITVPGNSFVVFLAFSPDGRVVAAGQENPPSVALFDVATHRRLRLIDIPRDLGSQPSLLRGLAFSPDGSQLVTLVRYSDTVRVWDVATGRQIHAVDGFEAAVMAVDIDPDGTRLAVGQVSGAVQIVDLATGRIVGDPFRGPRRRIIHLRFSPDGSLLAGTVEDSTAHLWDVETGLALGPRFQFDVETVNRQSALEFSPDGHRLLTVGRNGDVIAWDLEPERLVDHVCQLAGRNLTHGEWDRYMPDGMEYRTTCQQWPAAEPL